VLVFFTSVSVALSLDVLWRNKPLFGGPQLTRETRRNVKLLFVLGLVSFEGATEVYVRLPQQMLYGSSPQALSPGRSAKQKNVVLLFPGAGGPDKNSALLQRRIIEADRRKGVNRLVETYDWIKWRGPFVRASFDGQMVGRAVCTELAKEEKIKGPLDSLHVIGISVGAFAADSCVKAYNKNTKSNPEERAITRLTFLDPFTSKGIFGYAWGVNNFGKSADVVEDYLNRDDPVPTTSDPIKNAITFDVTDSASKAKWARSANDESSHAWPVVYLANNWKTEVDEDGELLLPTTQAEPRGAVIVVP